MESDIFFERGSPHHCPKKRKLCFNIIALKFYLSIKSIKVQSSESNNNRPKQLLTTAVAIKFSQSRARKNFFKEGGILLSLKQGKTFPHHRSRYYSIEHDNTINQCLYIAYMTATFLQPNFNR